MLMVARTDHSLAIVRSEPSKSWRPYKKRKEGQAYGQKKKETKIERTLTLLNRDIPSEDILSISSSQNNTQTVRKKRTLLLFSC